MTCFNIGRGREAEGEEEQKEEAQGAQALRLAPKIFASQGSWVGGAAELVPLLILGVSVAQLHIAIPFKFLSNSFGSFWAKVTSPRPAAIFGAQSLLSGLLEPLWTDLPEVPGLRCGPQIHREVSE